MSTRTACTTIAVGTVFTMAAVHIAEGATHAHEAGALPAVAELLAEMTLPPHAEDAEHSHAAAIEEQNVALVSATAVPDDAGAWWTMQLNETARRRAIAATNTLRIAASVLNQGD